MQTLGFVLRRVLVAIALLWVISILTFFLFFKIPAEPAGFLVDLQKTTPAQIAKARHVLGVDRPIYVQYGKYVWCLLHGDFGTSWATISFRHPDGTPAAR